VVKDTGGRTGIRIEVTWRAKAKDEARRRFLEDVYRPYWELQKPIDDFLRIRFGLTRTLFFEARARLDAFVKK
jgi:hypothetical protein